MRGAPTRWPWQTAPPQRPPSIVEPCAGSGRPPLASFRRISRSEDKPLPLLTRMASAGMGIWDAVGDDLARHYTVANFDLVGKAGLGEDLAPRARFERLADRSAEVAAALGVERFHVFGCYGGTHVALACMHRHRSRVASALLLDPFFELPDPRKLETAVAFKQRLFEGDDRALYAHCWVMAGFSPRFIEEQFDVIDRLARARIEQDRFVQAAAPRWLRALRTNWLADAELARMDTPVLVLATALDRRHAGPTPGMAAARVARLPNATPRTIEGCGTFVFVEEPSLLQAHAGEFLARQASARRRRAATGHCAGVRNLARAGRCRACYRRAVPPIVVVEHLSKVYASGFRALRDVSLAIRRGEIFALLGPNGAGKTTLISVVCGIVRATSGRVTVAGHDIVADYRAARALIGLVPQELTTDAFESVWNTVSFSRGLFGKPADPAHLERVLRDLSLWDRRDSKVMTLSGGMKRRLLIAKALSHQPQVLFLDEPTAGVDVTLRVDMWNLVRRLRDEGVTIILTTHYIDEAEEMADRVGVINGGEVVLVEEKTALMRKLGRKQLTLHLAQPLAAVPAALAPYRLELAGDGTELIYTYDTGAQDEQADIAALLRDLAGAGLAFRDLHTTQSSLEDIFVSLLREHR